jgi:NADPH2:quinone reductase
VVRRFPLTCGIDVAGEVVSSASAVFSEGQAVLVTGYGLGVSHDGGYAGYVRVPADWVVPLPPGLDMRQAMILGTAGFTAALAMHRMQQLGQSPALGPLLVTGASGGVGSIAVNLCHGLGYEVVAVSGKPELGGWLRDLGAAEVIGRDAVPKQPRPLESALWGGIIDNVGGPVLAALLPAVRPAGNVAAIGLAAGTELHTTVMPFLLRGVSLIGINSVDCDMALRRELWSLLAGTWRPTALDRIATRTVALDELPLVFEDMLAGRTHGRILVALDD